MRSGRLWASLLVSALLLWIAFRGQDLAGTLAALRTAEYWSLVPALGLYFLGVWVRSLRWKALLAPIARVSARSLFPVVVIGYMANDVLPARMGEVVRVYVLSHREQVSKTTALGTVVVERLLDAVVMLLLLAAAGLAIPLNGPVQRVALVASLALLVGAGGLLLVGLAPRTALRIARPVLSRLPGRLVTRGLDVGRGFHAGLRVVRDGRALGAALALSILAWLLEAGMYWTLALGFHLPVGAAAMMLTLAVANLATLVPAAPGYVGSFHLGALLVLSGLLSLDRDLASGYVLVLHAALVLPVTLLGFYYWGSHHLSLHRIRREAEATARPPARMEMNAVD